MSRDNVQKKEQKGSVGRALRVIWSVMTRKQKLFCIPLFFGLLIRPFAILMPIQCLAAVVAKFEGAPATVYGIVLPESWSVGVVAIFVFSLYFLFWMIGSSSYFTLWAMSGKFVNQINDKALEWALAPRKNMDIKMTKGEFCYLVKSSTDTVQDFIETIFIDLLPPIATFVLSLVYIGLIDWVVMLLIIAVSFVVVGCAYGRVHLERRPIVNEENYRAKINNLFLSSITNLPFISLFKSLYKQEQELRTLNDGYYKNVKKRSLVGWGYWAIIMLFQYGSMALAVIIANSRAASGALTISAVVLLLGYIINVYDPIENLGWNISNMQRYAIKISRINLIRPSNDVLILPAETRTRIESIEKVELQDISLRLGSFKLDNMSLTFNKGQIITLAGASSCGKTSIIQAMLGLKERAGGKIIVNGTHEVNSLFFDDEKISYALQEMQLFDKTLEENLLYPDLMPDERGQKIIKSLGVSDIIASNVDKVEGLERTLSGGEKKRINLARAFIKPADLYILDEPTNELDKKNVDIVLKILKQLKKRAIVVVISHDARVIDISDKVFYF